MSIWTRITDTLAALASGEGLGHLFDRLRTPPERTVGFAIAVIALGAKMAKADGRVTRDEVAAFREIFTIPPGEEAHAARVFNLARQDVVGYEDYARRIARLFAGNTGVLTDLLEGLFHIAVADGRFDPEEEDFLRRVAKTFGMSDAAFASIRVRHAPGSAPDPWAVLGLAPGAPLAEARAAWRRAVRASHPDGMIARGVPPEAVRVAETHLAAVNAAWETIRSSA